MEAVKRNEIRLSARIVGKHAVVNRYTPPQRICQLVVIQIGNMRSQFSVSLDASSKIYHLELVAEAMEPFCGSVVIAAKFASQPILETAIDGAP